MFIVLQCFVILLLAIYWATRNKEFNKIPGPPGIFLLNNALDILMDPVKTFYYFRSLCSQYKRIFRLQLGPLKVITVYHPEDVEAVISGSQYNTKGFVYDFIEPWLKEGLLISKGPKWQHRRKLLTPAFHFNVLANFKSVIEENCQRLIEQLRKEVNEPKTDVTPYVNDLAINSICETAMGTRLDDEDSDFSRKYKKGIYDLGHYATCRAQRLWMHPNFIFKHTTLGRKQESALKMLTTFRDRVIENRRNLSKDNNNLQESEGNDGDMYVSSKKKMALLDLLLAAEKKGVIDAKGVSEEVDTFMFGGHDTSANTLQFTMMLLANNQEAQEKAAKECAEIFESSDRTATMADLTQLKYLESCIKESMRLYPPLPVITRKIHEPLMLGKYQIPAGTECAILIFDLHRRADQFKEPLQFRPERFLSEPTWHPYGYIPFSAGPRNCIGQKFAMMELKLALSSLLRHYRILPVTKPGDIIFVTDYVLRIKEPIYVKFEKRI